MFDVIATVKSPSSDPVDIRWATGVSAVAAVAAVATLIADADGIPGASMPESVRTELVAARVVPSA